MKKLSNTFLTMFAAILMFGLALYFVEDRHHIDPDPSSYR
jgi:hypothetical protein